MNGQRPTHKAISKFSGYVYHYKDRKCAGNKKSSLRIEICRDKTTNNRPLSKWRSFEFFSYTKPAQITKMELSNGHRRNVIKYGGILVWGHLAKIKVDFFEAKLPVFIIVINNSCSAFVPGFTPAKSSFNNNALCQALWYYLEFLAGVNPRTNALAVGIYSYINSSQLVLSFKILLIDYILQ